MEGGKGDEKIQFRGGKNAEQTGAFLLLKKNNSKIVLERKRISFVIGSRTKLKWKGKSVWIIKYCKRL